MSRVLITGGAGYVGAVLVPQLLQAGHEVKVLDLMVFGKDVLPEAPALEVIEGDMREPALLKRAVENCDAVIHLACISNDPSFELDPTLGKSINFAAFEPLVDAALEAGVKRFIYASSSSVYGIKNEPNVSEDLPLEPLTDYSKFKAECEQILLDKTQDRDMVPLIVRPATVCGYSPRLRLDLTVNILTHHAVRNGRIRVFGGTQKRPNIHIQDMCRFYLKALEWPDEQIARKTYNVGYENHTVMEIAQMVQRVVERELKTQVEIATETTDDLRSYHISSAKVERELSFKPIHTIEDAVSDLVQAFLRGDIRDDSMEHPPYYNIRVMKAFQALDAVRQR